jgi:hypothetical protein
MIRQFLSLAGLLLSMQVMSQTGIGTTTPNASAKLDVSSSTLGFLPPRVTLTDANTFSPIVGTSSAATGLLVYNLGSVGLQAGYYYWNGANWATIATGTTAGNAVVAMDMVKLYSEVYSTATNKIAHSNGHSFTVPISGRYLFDFSSSGYVNQTSFTFTFSVRQGTTVLASDFQTSANNNIHVEYNGKLEVNLQSGTTYNVYVNSTGSRDNGDYDRVYYKMVAGNLPVNQHMAERNLQLNDNFISNDGGNEGIRIDNTGNVGIGTNTPTSKLNIAGGGIKIASGLGNSSTRPNLNTNSIGNYEIRGVGGGSPQIDTQDDGFLRLSAGGGSNLNTQSSIDITGYSTVADMSNNIVMRTGGTERLRIDPSGNVNITGKLNILDPTGNVVIKAAGFVGRGTDITLENLKVRFAASGGNMSLQVSSGSGTISTLGSDQYITDGSGSTTISRSITASPIYLWPGLNFLGAGNSETCILIDTNTKMSWRIIGIVGPGYSNNFISIERLF